MERSFNLQENTLKFMQFPQAQLDGVQLTATESEYLLPHFLMLLIGKPGSGKTTLLKQLLTNDQMYARKFDDVLIVSPSYAKMDLRIREENARTKFSLDWIFMKLDEINEEQRQRLFGTSKQKNKPGDKLTSLAKATPISGFNKTSRFDLTIHSDRITPQVRRANTEKQKELATTALAQQQMQADMENAEVEEMKAQQQLYREIMELDSDRRAKTHRNVLLVLDDVVASIKKSEFDPRLGQLVMNRRHFIYNGTLSIIIVSQKYSMIPGRIRSNANWLVFYQLNPIDFENIYRDVVVHDMNTWRSILKFVFGKTLRTEDGGNDGQQSGPAEEFKTQKGSSISEFIKSKKFENLGVWVEYNIYFKNFKRILI